MEIITEMAIIIATTIITVMEITTATITTIAMDITTEIEGKIEMVTGIGETITSEVLTFHPEIAKEDLDSLNLRT